jgi:L-serine dehydratase
MMAAREFRKRAEAFLSAQAAGKHNDLCIKVELYGSLSLTGQGHGTDAAVSAGLSGLNPRSSSVEDIWAAMPDLNAGKLLELCKKTVRFVPQTDIVWLSWTLDDKPLPHPNTMRFRLLNGSDVLLEELIASVGGGFVEVVDAKSGQRVKVQTQKSDVTLPYPYETAQDFVQICTKGNLPVWKVVIANQEALGTSESELRKQLADILKTMEAAIERGLHTEGILPGGLNVRRRAKELFEQMHSGKTPAWAGNDLRPSVYAMAVNEENAAGGRVVTAPTNGSSGIIPAVWRCLKENNRLSEEMLENGLIAASVVGALVKTHASISGAEVGCQGEVGTSCAMAAAGAVSMLGGSAAQMEQAAEMGIEHHLGMTCDPIKGLVQIPCIERNAMGAVKALNACALALASDGSHMVSLDRALEVMRQTGLDMNQKYKETATGGLALG